MGRPCWRDRADVAIYPILTLDAAKWQQPSADLDEPLHIVEISDPGQREPEEQYLYSVMAHCTYSHAADRVVCKSTARDSVQVARPIGSRELPKRRRIIEIIAHGE